ncbi:MAG TPA: hypothetical protein DDY78_08345 [Planctomycetales bacterium]|jgi:hypothetical protein|nr:hypothetical protein [Planctomycetales bacterium]
MAEKDGHAKDFVAAHHEAGHAVGAYMLGVPTKVVYIEADGSGEGDWKPALTIGEIRKHGLWPEYAICGELGRTVERMLFGSSDSRFCDDDQDVIDRLLLTFLPDRGEREKFKAKLPQLAEDVTRRPFFFESVKAVAQELLKGERLDNTGVKAVIEEASRKRGRI